MFAADDDGKGGGGGGDGKFSQTDIDSAVKTAVEKAVGDTTALRQNNANLLKEKQDAVSKASQFDGMDSADVESYKTYKKEKANADRKKKEDAGKFEDLEKQLIAKHGEELSKKDVRIKKLYGILTEKLVDAELTTSLAKKGGQPHLILHALKDHVGIVEDDKGIRAQVIDPITKNVKIADDKGTPMSMDQLVDSFHTKAEWAGAFAGTKQSGMGNSNKNHGKGFEGKTMTQTEFANLDIGDMEQARALRKKGELKVING